MPKRTNPFAGSTVADRTGARAPVARHLGDLADHGECTWAGPERRVRQEESERWHAEERRRSAFLYPVR